MNRLLLEHELVRSDSRLKNWLCSRHRSWSDQGVFSGNPMHPRSSSLLDHKFDEMCKMDGVESH